MYLNVDLSALWAEVNKIAKNPADFAIERASPREDIDIKIGSGMEVDLEDIDFSGPVAALSGRQVLLYIPDHGSNLDKVKIDPVNGKRFHVTFCTTLEEMRSKKRFDRYIATNDLSGYFRIKGVGSNGREAVSQAKLHVCKNCLQRLNYKGAQDGKVRAQVAAKFDIAEFFETFSSYFRHMPSGLAQSNVNGYTDDWVSVSEAVRQQAAFICSDCEINLQHAPRLLHVHHINGVKHDNTLDNLVALCADCHRRQPHHQHMHITHRDMQLINRYRREQDKLGDSWIEALKFADPAAHGALDLIKAKGWPAPEIGYELVDDTGAVLVELEAAWPQRQVALVLTSEAKSLVLAQRWRARTVGEVLSRAIK